MEIYRVYFKKGPKRKQQLLVGGKAILHSKWEEVIDLILQPREGDNAMVARARKTWKETQDAHAALAGFTKPCTERHLLVGLRDCGKNDLTAAINRISKNTRLMYLHSYQAFIWNRMVSERLRMGGTKLLPGDLVIPVADMRSNKRAAPVVVTEDNLYQFTIHDLVLPSPGYDMTYPEGALREKYEALLAEDGLTLDSFRHKNKDYSLSGMYRAVIHKPDDLEYELLRYEDYTKPLVLSDLDKLQGQTLDDEKEDRLLALRLKFTLPPSTYATMAIRELLKCDTSAAFQSTLNVS